MSLYSKKILFGVIFLACYSFLSCGNSNSKQSAEKVDGVAQNNQIDQNDSVNKGENEQIGENRVEEAKLDPQKTDQLIDKLLNDAKNFVKNREYEKAVTAYQLAANLGNNKAKYELANLYMGTGVDEYLAKARELYEAASSEVLDANLALGHIYRDGIGVQKDIQKAVEYYKKADQTAPETKYLLGLIHHPKTGRLPDAEQAIKYLKEAGDGGLGIAYRMAADVCLYSEKYPETIEFYEKAVALGDVKSMNALATYYYFPEEDYIKQVSNVIDLDNTPELAEFKKITHDLYTKTAWKHDPKRGLELETAAAEAGDIPSMNALSQWYASGAYGVAVDNEKAQYWKQQYDEHVAQRNAQNTKK